MAFFNESPDFNGIQDLPLPGGADLGDHPYEVTAEFADVLSLVPQSAVKVNDVSVGRVGEIELAEDGWTALVTMKINGEVRLPANSYARIEQSSLLGEKYVQLIAPEKGQEVADRLGDGGDTDSVSAMQPVAADVDIPLTRTNRNPEVEEVFGALSMLLNGGGIQQLRTITQELNKTLTGNETEIRSMLRQVNTLTGSLDSNKENITKALDGLNRLSATLATRKQEIGGVLDGLSPGMKVLEEQRGSLMTMLRSLNTLSDTAVQTINRSKDDMIADLKALGPVLKNLADAGEALPDSLQVLLTYPFTDAVLDGVKGDYLNAYLRVTAAPGTQIVPPLIPPADGAAAGTLSGVDADGLSALRDGTGALPLPLPSVGEPTTSAGDGASAVPTDIPTELLPSGIDPSDLFPSESASTSSDPSAGES
ncbi:MCE family protein [Streptomyces sp. NPDC051940]|uniref:MCE family protein n=1 Tax=Streptomyces sp. NPDC051940 TaxID=3155675 RepID=UPI0034150C1D